MTLLSRVPAALTPLAVAAAVLALLAPSHAVAARGDVLLAALVAATALGIPGRRLLELRRHAGTVAVLSIVPFVVLGAVGWALSRLFGGGAGDGVLAVGLSSSEVATVGLAALAGADATIALGAVAGSLVLAALAGPALIGPLAGAPAHLHASSAHLLGRFALVVLAPLAAGVAIRSLPRPGRWLTAREGPREGIASLAVVALVYAALSATNGAHGLGRAALASLAFLAIGGALAALWRERTRPSPVAMPGALAIGMRDFAIAAALAGQAFGATGTAAAVPGVYGVLMLLAGGAAASGARRANSAPTG